MPSRSRLLALAALGLILIAGGLPLGLAPARPSQPDAPSPLIDGRLPDAAAVKAVLESLGYTPQDAGGGNWLFTRKQGEWEISIYVMLNVDSTVLWIKCFLGRLENPTTYQTSHYVALLEEQGRISPRFFFTVPVEGGHADLFCCRGLDNRALTTTLIGDEIALLQTSMAQSVKSWNFAEWTRTDATPVAQPGADAPASSEPTPP